MSSEIEKPETQKAPDKGSQKIRSRVQEAVKLGHLDFYYQNPDIGSCILWLFSRERRSPGFFCQIIQRQTPKEFIGELRTFISTNYPEAAHLPIRIFTSIDNYLYGTPTLTFVERFGLIDPKAS